MFRYLPACLLAAISLFSIPVEFSAQNFESSGISYEWDAPDNAEKCEDFFVATFAGIYQNVPLEVLRKENWEAVVAFLHNAFEDDFHMLQKPDTDLVWLTAKKRGKAYWVSHV